MPQYRRWFVPGGTYFVTANLLRRDSRLLVEQIEALRTAYADADDLAVHIDYVHANPVKHRLVADIDDWPFSSWHRWKRGNEAGAMA